MAAYTAYYTSEHDECLAHNKPDWPDETHDSLVCSRSSCQYLHDRIYGDSVLSAKYFQKEVSACFEKVREYQAEQAQKAKEQAERKAKDEKEEAEQKAQDEKDEADRAARRQRDKDESDAHDAKRTADRAARDQAEEQREAAEKQAESDRIAAQRSQTYAQPAPPTRQTRATNPSSSQNSATSTLVDPFNDSGSSKSQGNEIAANESMVDPFPPASPSREPASLVDPFPADSTYLSTAQKALETAITKGQEVLKVDMSTASRTLHGKQLQEYLEDAHDTYAVLGGLGKMLKSADYATEIAQIYKAETPEKRSKAEVDLATTFAKDVSAKGISVVAERLFPRAAAALSGPVGWTAYVGSEVLTPKDVGRDAREIIGDSSGATSLQEKQQALFYEWRAYETNGNNWSDRQKQNLLKDTELVYQQANSQPH